MITYYFNLINNNMNNHEANDNATYHYHTNNITAQPI